MNNSSKQPPSLHQLLLQGSVVFYGYTNRTLPDIITQKQKGSVFVYTRQSPLCGATSIIHPKRYRRISEIRKQSADVLFLDHDAIRVLSARFSTSARYILVRFSPRFSSFLASPSLLRYLLRGHLHFEGTTSLSGPSTTRWFVFKNPVIPPTPGASLSAKVGVEAFFDYLRNEKIQYVVLRFYERLPDLGRPGGDLDILVSDEDQDKITAFLKQHKGDIPIDISSVSSIYRGDLPYYPPPLAKQILQSALRGPAGSQIPAPKEAFLGLAYHALYHKGIDAGVPSTLSNVVVDESPENDYTGTLARMARDLNIQIDITMEDLDEYLSKEGWRPKLDTLAKIALENEWVWRRFFSGRRAPEIGLGVFLLKKGAFDLGVVEKILQVITEEGLHIIRTKRVSQKERQHVADHLRGGNWFERGERSDSLLPAMIIVVLDPHFARLPSFSASTHSFNDHLKAVKSVIRSRFDRTGTNIVHSTDNTSESWEYVEVCFPKELEDIKQEVDVLCKKFRASFLERMVLFFKFVPYRIRLLLRMGRERFIRWMVG